MLQRALTIPQPDGEAADERIGGTATQLGAVSATLCRARVTEQVTVPPIPIGPFREGSTALEI
jgi:hypothetical protein